MSWKLQIRSSRIFFEWKIRTIATMKAAVLHEAVIYEAGGADDF